MKPPGPRSKTMRVATALTGMTACAGGFLPTAAAHAASAATRPGNLTKTRAGEGEKLVRLKVAPGGITPDVRTMRADITADPNEPYWLNIIFKNSVTKTQVCGYHPNGWHCTPWTPVSERNNSSTKVLYNVGGNKYSWDLGEIKVYWDGGGPGHWDECNTNGAWYGQWYSFSGHRSATMSDGYYGGIGNGVPEC